jgi:hypothetical protein
MRRDRDYHALLLAAYREESDGQQTVHRYNLSNPPITQTVNS